MGHVRQQLRESVATAVTGLTDTGTRVFQSRLYPLQTKDLPCLIVTTEGDSIEYLTVNSPATLERETIVRIKAIARETTDLDDKLDDICQQVEVAISNTSLIAKSINFIGTEMDESAVGEKPVGTATLTYAMKVYTLENAPQTAL
jgi:hypothetical protein